MNSSLLFCCVILYLGLLFLVAYLSEKRKKHFWVNNPYIYSLSLAVFCSAWTYYGSIGVAANSGLEFLTTYIGPIIIIPSWIYLYKKIIRITKVHKISSIADFISLRYGNRRSLGAVVTLVCIMAIVPYIGLQIKAISESFHLLTNTPEASSIFQDSASYVVLILAIFTSYFGTRYADASEKRLGVISAIATESFLKLIFFIITGIFVTFGVFNGFEDLYQQASQLPDFKKITTFKGLEDSFNWSLLSLLSMMAIFLLPRQFHTGIIENKKEKHIHTAIWLFPLYLFLINIFVFPIAWGGKILFDNTSVNPDFYSLLIPQKSGNTVIASLVFFGGLSASVSMIIISSITLSVMLSNNLVIPYGWLGRLKHKTADAASKTIINIRKASIFLLILIAFIFYKVGNTHESSLFNLGLISFVIIAQLGPGFFGAIFWRRGTYNGTIMGIVVGITICYLGLIHPIFFPNTFSFFKIPYFSNITNTFFWSLLFNIGCYAIISVNNIGNYRDRNFAEIYVDVDDYIQNHEKAYIWKGTGNISDIKNILVCFLGEKKTEQALKIFNAKYNISDKESTADARFIKFSENLLSGRIGTASAKILIEGVTQEEEISLSEVLKILEESKENITLNKQLQDKSHQLTKLSHQLQMANENLVFKDRQKDEFLDSVAHELRTPITAIRNTGEILLDDDMPKELRQEFLENIISESDRLSEIINDLLFLDKLEFGKINLNITQQPIVNTFEKAFKPLYQLFEQQKVETKIINALEINKYFYDEAKMIQVFQNILGNALKFTPENGRIQVKFNNKDNGDLRICLFNSGSQIPKEDLDYIFDKFYQSKNQNINKPLGSGLGLAISKKIIKAHEGEIKAYNLEDGVEFEIIL
ncbi:sensor histidine kinase [Elizabethkingia sp. JS20170427COW]|uniref:sensor histidine kinase n=1 Tax=Elizabethkingia sp. JS20170427COW TaxID=2583851 RepID=UPI00143DC018|nr:sensor histidine kinase [Elizabethkingia sp. JS20170427COW]